MNTVVLLSGGMDSAVLLADLLDAGNVVEALSFDYGQRHRRELDAANAVARYYGVPHSVLPLPLAALAPTSSQTNEAIPVPHGHYADESMRVTVVPNRNMVMLSIAIARAIATGATAVAFAAHSGDHAVYPDCRQAFIEAMRKAARLCDYAPIQIDTPYCLLTKAEIAERGQRLAVPFELTYSCYEGAEAHCGACGTCVERREAFELARVSDPTDYQCQPVPAA